MALEFILGASGTGKTTYIYDEILKKAAEDKHGEYIVIVPEQFTLQTQRDLIKLSSGNAINNIDAVSFLRLAYRLFEEKGGEDRIILEDTGKSMIVKKVLLDKKEQLRGFAGNIRKQGFVDEVKSVISEFTQYSINLEDIDKMLETKSFTHALKSKLTDIRTIYQGFNEFIEKKYITAEGIYEVMSWDVEKSNMIRNANIYIDGFTGFTPSQYKLMEMLIKYARNVYVTVTIDEKTQKIKQLEHQLFYLSYNTINKLEKIAAENKVYSQRRVLKERKRYVKNSGLAALEANIFRYPYKAYFNNFDDVKIWKNNDVSSEIIRTAVEIKKLVKEKNFRYRDIAVISGDIEQYGSELALSLEKFGIPSFVDSKQRILTNPAVEMLRSMVEIIEYDFNYESVFRFLKTGFTGIEENNCDELENYVIALGIKGKSRYSKKFSRKYKTIYEPDLENINKTRESLMELIMPVYNAFVKKDSTVAEKLKALYDFFNVVELEKRLSEYAEEYSKSDDINGKIRAKEYSQVYKIILEVFDRIAVLLGDDVLEITEFREILDTGLKEAKAGLIPPGIDQVLIGDIERTRLKDIRALFILGINDGIIPKNTDKGGILNEADRSAILEAGVELSPSKREQAYQTEFYMYLNMTKPSEMLYLSYVCLNSEGRAVRSSYIISKVNTILRGNLHIASDDNETALKVGVDKGRGYLALNIRSYYDVSDRDELFKLLFKYYRERLEGGKLLLEDMISEAFGIREDSKIDEAMAKLLYGSTITGSVTRMEKYAECSFAYFMMYGLRLEERKEFEISMPDIGIIYHNALDEFSEKLAEQKIGFKDIDDKILNGLLMECADNAVRDFGNGILDSTKRNEYIKERVKRVLLRTVKTIRAQVSKGDFNPWKFEQAFEHTERFLRIKGRIDRIDIYEKEGKTYLDIIDYKSGTKKFDLESLYYGLSIQLALYMHEGIKLAGKELDSKDIIPAGMFYYNIDDPIVDKCNNPEDKIQEALKLNGLVNENSEVIEALDNSFKDEAGGIKPSIKSRVIPVSTTSKGVFDAKSNIAKEKHFNSISKYAVDKMYNYSKEIMEGNITKNPYMLDKATACDYCQFKGICGFDAKNDGYRKLKKLTDDEILKRIDDMFGEKKDELE